MRLVETEEIKRLKGRYQRALDAGRWEEFASYLTEDFTVWESGYGAHSGRELVVQRTRAGYEAFGGWSHHAILPDIEITSETTAKGIWTFGDGFYEDEYVKENDQWKVKATRVNLGKATEEKLQEFLSEHPELRPS
jgi:hypothetical protein